MLLYNKRITADGFSCLITQRLLRELPPISVTKLWGVNVYKVFNKRSKKKPPKTDGLIKHYGGQDLCKSPDY